MKKNALIRYPLLIAAIVLSIISNFFYNDYLNGSGYNINAKLLMLGAPILVMIIILINEILIIFKLQKYHYISHLPNIVLIFLLGTNPIINVIFYPDGLQKDPLGPIAFILWVLLLINNIVIDRKVRKQTIKKI